jgi:hypothetical protein
MLAWRLSSRKNWALLNWKLAAALAEVPSTGRGLYIPFSPVAGSVTGPSAGVVWLLEARLDDSGARASRSTTTVMMATVVMLFSPKAVMVVTTMVVEAKDWVGTVSQDSKKGSNASFAAMTSRLFSSEHVIHAWDCGINTPFTAQSSRTRPTRWASIKASSEVDRLVNIAP